MTIILALQLHLQFVQKINWDEFFYLSHIYDAQEGRLYKARQMGHVYLFRWLIFIPGGEIAQITTGRVMMWLAQLTTLILIVKTARRFMPLTSALFAALSFLGLGFVFIHGTSFRADPFAALCMMVAVYMFVVSDFNRKNLMILAIALALGAFVTIKVILFSPLFFVLALWRLVDADDAKVLFVKLGTTLVCAGLLFALSLFLHVETLQEVATENRMSSLSSTAETVFLSGGLFPRMGVMKDGLLIGFIPLLMIGLGLLVAIVSCIKNKSNRSRDIIIIAMALPLLSFVFYRNAYPYFYAFIFPTAVIVAGYATARLQTSKSVMIFISATLTAIIVLLHNIRTQDTRIAQTQTITAVHEIFPEPVNYFDRNGMIASFPKAGFFMSSWGIRNYGLAGKPWFSLDMDRKIVPLLIENSPAISSALRNETTPLLEKDAAALRDNYILHWGHIWVAGKTLSVSETVEQFTISIPGKYTVECQKNIWIDGQLYSAGDIIILDRGAHNVRSDGEQTLVLRWGDKLLKPVNKANAKPIFTGF